MQNALATWDFIGSVCPLHLYHYVTGKKKNIVLYGKDHFLIASKSTYFWAPSLSDTRKSDSENFSVTHCWGETSYI